MELKKIFLLFIGWRSLLFIFLFFAISTLPLQKDLLGGGLTNYLKNPYLWSWINFDGEHYLSIAKDGYLPLTYFYFPLYPLSIRFFAHFMGNSFQTFAIIGLLLSHLAFFIGLAGFVKLIQLDYSDKIVNLSILILLLFPTSFYFAGYYTESLFFALSIWAFYLARKNKWILAGILGGLACTTRIVGISLFPALVAEYFYLKRTFKLTKDLLALFLIPAGLLLYMIFLNIKTGDPLEFLNSVGIFGQQRSSNLILLPQVFYRYIFKILPSINYNYFPVVFSTWMEFLIGFAFGLLTILALLGSIKKLKPIKFRVSYAIYLILGYLIPTLSGSFSSLPRYVLILFPAFFLLSVYLIKLPSIFSKILLLFSIILLGISTSLFTRGYWIA